MPKDIQKGFSFNKNSLYPSLDDLAKSPFISSWNLMLFRLASLLSHIVVIITGIYTRKLRFFVQYTNWTNMISFFSVLITFITSFRYNLAHNGNEMVRIYERTRPSKTAYLAQELLKISFPMHIMTTGVFWPLVFPYATIKDPLSIVYFFFAHGVTLFFVLVEIFLTRVVFEKRLSPMYLKEIIKTLELDDEDAKLFLQMNDKIAHALIKSTKKKAKKDNEDVDEALELYDDMKWVLQIERRSNFGSPRMGTIMTIAIAFCIVGICVYYTTGWAVYPFFDLSKPLFSFPMMSLMFVVIPLIYFIAIMYTRFRDFIIIKVRTNMYKEKIEEKKIGKKTKPMNIFKKIFHYRSLHSRKGIKQSYLKNEQSAHNEKVKMILNNNIN